MSLNFMAGQRVIVNGRRPLIDRIAVIDLGPEVASHQRDGSWQVPTVYRVVYERTGEAEWVLSSRLQAYGRASRMVVPWSDCPWQPRPEVIAFIERSGLGERLLQLRRALVALRREGRA